MSQVISIGWFREYISTKKILSHETDQLAG